jgi:hypothetical protein
VETFTIGLGDRWWSRVWSRNPLVRRTDRIEVMVLSLAVLLTVVAMPIAGRLAPSCTTHAHGSTPRRRKPDIK